MFKWSKTRWLVSIIIFLFIALFAWYLATFREVNVISLDVQKSRCQLTVELTDGQTCYALTGPVNGPLVVFVHGATIPSWAFDPQVEAFEKSGFLVLRYDMFGRGFSQRPDVAYTREFYIRQLRELLDKTAPNKEIAIVGHSFGGAIATAYAATHPQRVSHLVLLAPVINSIQAKAPFIIARLFLIDKFIARTIMVDSVRSRAKKQYEKSKLDVAHYDALFEQQTTYEGFEKALLSMFKTDALKDYRDAYGKVGKSNIPTLLVYGDEDIELTPERVKDVETLIPHLKKELFLGVAHAPNIEQPKRFNQTVISFLRQ